MAEDSVMVTGLGVVCALGGGLDESRPAVHGKDGAGPVTVFDTSGCRCRTAAEVKSEWLEPDSNGIRKFLAGLAPRDSRSPTGPGAGRIAGWHPGG